MNTRIKLISVILFSAVAGGVLTYFSGIAGNDDKSAITETVAEPLYWVAPMDPEYQRDEPGKSPMGMDLIPVYAKAENTDDSPGIIHISADVINNIGVRSVSVKRDVLHSEIHTVGYVQYNQDTLQHIHPRVEGWIEKLYVKAAGDPVEKDQPLYALYSPQLVNAQEEYLLALNRNNVSLISAAENRLRALQLSNAFIQNLKRKRQVQQTIVFNAPQSGVVDNLNIREGFFVKPGTTLMSIGRLDEVWVEAEVFARQAAWVEAGLPVTMKLDYQPGKSWQGKVDYVYPTLDAKTRTVRVRLRFTNINRQLKPNMYAQVVIHTAGQEPELLVPREAVIRTGNRDVVVLALGDGRFKSVAVETGAADQQHVAIQQGVAEGDQVVVSAQFLLDSESSKRSDFKRMHHQGQTVESVWTTAQIHSVNQSGRTVTIEHANIPEWQQDAMLMTLRVADPVDISELYKGLHLHLQLSHDGQGGVSVTAIHIMVNSDEMPSSPEKQ